jgi:hypothetical protein
MLRIAKNTEIICRRLGLEFADLADCPDGIFFWPEWLNSKMYRRAYQLCVLRIVDPALPHQRMRLTPQGRAVRDLYKAKKDLAAASLRHKLRTAYLSNSI